MLWPISRLDNGTAIVKTRDLDDVRAWLRGLDAARRSVPSEALAEAAGYLADAAKHLADHVTEAKFYCEDTDNVQHFAAKVRAILAALPNREDAPEPPAIEDGHDHTASCQCLPIRVVVDQHGHYWRDYGDHWSMCPVSDENVATTPVTEFYRLGEGGDLEDAPSREGLDAVVAAVVADLGQSDGLHQYDRGIHRMPGCAACSLRARLAAALAATPPGDREDADAIPVDATDGYRPDAIARYGVPTLGLPALGLDSPAGAGADDPVVREDAPSREGLDVEPGHNHTTGGFPTFPVCRAACPLGCDALRAGEIAANTGKRPNLAAVDPFVEVAAMQAVRAAALAATPPGDREALTTEEWSRQSAAAMRKRAEEMTSEEAAVATAEAAAGEEGS